MQKTINGRNGRKGDPRNDTHTLAIRRIMPGDILLTRVPMSFDDPESWPSHIIQKATRSRYSHGALCIGGGLFAEAVGTGVGRLGLLRCAVRDPANACVLRLRKSVAGAVARRAASAGEQYLAQGFSRRVIPAGKGSAFDHPQRVAAQYAQLIARAYESAGLTLVPDKAIDTVTPGDLVASPYLEDVSASVIESGPADSAAHFYLDDQTLFERFHHWEVVTKLKILCGDDVKRVLHGLKERPVSFQELEVLLAQRKLRPLDAALHRGLTWYRFAEVYLEKKLRVLTARGGDLDGPLEQMLPSLFPDGDLDQALLRATLESEQLELERQQRVDECRRYAEYCDQYPAGKAFAYLAELHGRLLEVCTRDLEAAQRQVLRLREETARRGVVLQSERLRAAAQAHFDPLKV